MTISQAYNAWSQQYDNMINRTRDVEARAVRDIFKHDNFEKILEIGCGTGKNTEWYLQKAQQVVGVDFSADMLAKAREKITSPQAQFIEADITETWQFEHNSFDLVAFSLVLEHIEQLDFIFAQAQRVLKKNGRIYLGELHPFKQYQGSKARFETTNGDVFVLDCFLHHVSDYCAAAQKQGLSILSIQEWFDEPTVENSPIPRILSLVFEKKN
ncbi:MAG: class I SAM-dependent methyltransferase [Saprospiraceae bacterium]|nr:class I SAM-dependent methyltransferase [Saprospiraceae bacterium]